MSLNIIGTGGAFPGTGQSNDVLSNFVDTSDEWISTRTGIKTRHVCVTATVTDIALRAALKALEDSGTKPEELDFIICSTIRGDYVVPSLACLLQGELKATCPAFDINAACCGFLYALNVADSFIVSGQAKKILIVSAEAMSRVIDWTDRSNCVLFGDGAGAVVVEPGDSLLAMKVTAQGSKEFMRIANGRGNCPIGMEHLTERSENPIVAESVHYDTEALGDYRDGAYTYLIMDGQEVYKFAVSTMLKDIPDIVEKAGLTMDDIDLILPHQANLRIINAARTRLKLPMEKFKTNLERMGNTSDASIPLLLDELNRTGQLKKGMHLLLSAFGAGLTTAACVIRWNK